MSNREIYIPTVDGTYAKDIAFSFVMMTCSLLGGMQQNSVGWNDIEANVSYKEAILGSYNDFQIKKEEIFSDDVEDYILKENIDRKEVISLRNLIKKIFLSSDVFLGVYFDAEELWSRLLFEVHSNVDDMDEFAKLEDDYYQVICKTNEYDNILRKSIVSFS